MKKKGFSKKMLVADYIVAIALIVSYIVCVAVNGVYARDYIETAMLNGLDVSMISVPQILNLDGFSIFLGTWIGQLGVSSGFYYYVLKTERKVQMPMMLLNDLPQDVKDNIDMTQIITSVLSMSE